MDPIFWRRLPLQVTLADSKQMNLTQLLEEWAAHYLGGMGLRLAREFPRWQEVEFVLTWRDRKVFRGICSLAGEGGLKVYYTPGTLPKGVEEGLFRVLRALLPSGANISAPFKEGDDTFWALERGVPLPLTHLGFLLWLSGAREFKIENCEIGGKIPLSLEEKMEGIGEMEGFYLKEENSSDPLIIEALERWSIISGELL